LSVLGFTCNVLTSYSTAYRFLDRIQAKFGGRASKIYGGGMADATFDRPQS